MKLAKVMKDTLSQYHANLQFEQIIGFFPVSCSVFPQEKQLYTLRQQDVEITRSGLLRKRQEALVLTTEYENPLAHPPGTSPTQPKTVSSQAHETHRPTAAK